MSIQHTRLAVLFDKKKALPAVSTPPLRVGFVFNHEAFHQIAHAAPILNAMVSYCSAMDFYAIASLPEARAVIKNYLAQESLAQVSLIDLPISKKVQPILQFLDKIVPASRLAFLYFNRHFLNSFDALIAPDATLLKVRQFFGVKHPKLIYTNHGAGDRSITVHKALRNFDFLLLPGPKMRKRMHNRHLIKNDNYAVIGYLKFDACANTIKNPERFFKNNRPTIVYNPHFDPKLSSWYKMGIDVLEYFYHNKEYNLIFAPHVMLFKKRFHASVEHALVRMRYDIPKKYKECDNILIDVASDRLIDMSYTMGSDLYIGDVSSQVYEFLLNPRPCLFLDPNKTAWVADENYKHWQAGPVITNTHDLADGLKNAFASHAARYSAIQKKLFLETFDYDPKTPAAQKAAIALQRYLEETLVKAPLSS
jgi:hypothetical protein